MFLAALYWINNDIYVFHSYKKLMHCDFECIVYFTSQQKPHQLYKETDLGWETDENELRMKKGESRW